MLECRNPTSARGRLPPPQLMDQPRPSDVADDCASQSVESTVQATGVAHRHAQPRPVEHRSPRSAWIPGDRLVQPSFARSRSFHLHGPPARPRRSTSSAIFFAMADHNGCRRSYRRGPQRAETVSPCPASSGGVVCRRHGAYVFLRHALIWGCSSVHRDVVRCHTAAQWTGHKKSRCCP